MATVEICSAPPLMVTSPYEWKILSGTLNSKRKGTLAYGVIKFTISVYHYSLVITIHSRYLIYAQDDQFHTFNP